MHSTTITNHPIYGQLRAMIMGAEAQGLDERELAQLLVPILEPDSRPLKPKEAAEYLGVSTISLQRWRSQKRGPKYRKDKDTGLITYLLGSLKAYKKQGTQ